MASMIELTLEFEVGELVFFRASQHVQDVRPRQFCIVERFAAEYHHGFQRFYRLATLGDELYPEVALTREEPAYRPAVSAMVEEAAAITWRSLRPPKQDRQNRSEP